MEILWNQDLQSPIARPSAKVLKYLFFLFFLKNIFYLSNCCFCSWMLYTSGTTQKADHYGTKEHYESLFPCVGAYLCSVLHGTAFPVMTRPPMAVILNLFHSCPSLPFPLIRSKKSWTGFTDLFSFNHPG